VIIGVASKSEEEPLRTNFKDTALENMGTTGLGANSPTTIKTGDQFSKIDASTTPSSGGGKMTKYSEWKFVADKNNDHSKIYRAYHESW
jgi:hypothetical protein